MHILLPLYLELASKAAKLLVLLVANSSHSCLGLCKLLLSKLQLALKSSLVLQAACQLLRFGFAGCLCFLYLLPDASMNTT